MAAASSASAFSGDQKTDFWVTKRHPSVRSRPLVSSVEDGFISSVRWIFPGTKRNPIGDDFSVSGRTGSVSSRFDREREVGSSFTAIGLASSISGQAQEAGSNRKPKSKLSWFGKLTPSRAMGCLRLKIMKSSSKSSDPGPGGDLSAEERLRLKKAKNDMKQSERRRRRADIIKNSRALRASIGEFLSESLSDLFLLEMFKPQEI